VTLHLHGSGSILTWRGFLQWAGNIFAVPWRGMHVEWAYEARRLAERIARLNPDRLTLYAHSRHAAVALYVAVMVRSRCRHTAIVVHATAPPRVWFRRRWAAHYGRYLASCTVDVVGAHGDPVGWLPPWFRHDSRVRWVGPKRVIAIEAHNASYIRRHDGEGQH
jgi:pimeloyl-ACP methyl ester carboxylesterase